MTSTQNNSSMVHARPLLVTTSQKESEPPFVRMDSPEYELVRKQLVALYSSSPLYQKHAKATGNEMQYWCKFSAGGKVRPPKTPTGFSLEELKGMTIPEIVTAVQARNKQPTSSDETVASIQHRHE